MFYKFSVMAWVLFMVSDLHHLKLSHGADAEGSKNKTETTEATCEHTCRENYRPCNFTDFPCMGEYLSKHSNCSAKVTGKIPKVEALNSEFLAPVFNTTLRDQYMLVEGIGDCCVSEFFVDECIDVAVLTIDCPKMHYEANRTALYHRSKKLDLYYTWTEYMDYGLTRFTVNIPKKNGKFDLCGMRTYVYPEITSTPKIIQKPQNKETEEFLSTTPLGLIEFRQTLDRQIFQYGSKSILVIHVDYLICFFGCDIKLYTDFGLN